MENSKFLLEKALDILNEADFQEGQWAVGGGTVLSEIYHHRLSKDIDIFIDDIQLISTLSPKINDVSSEALYYNEGSQFVSLTYREGKVDFIASPQITKFSAKEMDFYSHHVYVEDSVEIVCKKLFYRGTFAVPRDLFDLAVVFESNRKKDLLLALNDIPDKVETFYEAILQKLDIKKFEPYSINCVNMILPNGKKFKNKELVICSELLNSLNKKYK